VNAAIRAIPGASTGQLTPSNALRLANLWARLDQIDHDLYIEEVETGRFRYNSVLKREAESARIKRAMRPHQNKMKNMLWRKGLEREKARARANFAEIQELKPVPPPRKRAASAPRSVRRASSRRVVSAPKAKQYATSKRVASARGISPNLIKINVSVAAPRRRRTPPRGGPALNAVTWSRSPGGTIRVFNTLNKIEKKLTNKQYSELMNIANENKNKFIAEISKLARSPRR
jgi:hypothetical protein